jgi:gluconolactonase
MTLLAVLALATMLGPRASAAPAALSPLDGRPDATINLATREGAGLVKAEWRYSDARIVEIDSKGPGPDLRASGKPIQTYDTMPKAGGADFDDSGWQVIDPATLEQRRATGRLCFNWYRTRVTIPSSVGRFDPTGATLVFEIVVDDYAEVWVNGKLSRVLGQSGSGLIRGFNAPNRVVLGRDVKPGQQFQLAVFGMNGPISDPPANFIWIRSATLDFYKAPESAGDSPAEITRVDPELDAIVPANAKIEKLAGGFQFVEGPVWVPEGYLLFSDPNNNMIYRWSPDDGVSVFRAKSGYAGVDIGEYGQPGSNGLALDREGRLTICEHGNRRVTRLEKNGVLTVLADRYEGARLNSPNDLVYRSDGALFFTDPPFGLPKFFADPRKELPSSGVFCLIDGKLKRVATELSGPNGLAFSPDERYLYVGNWDEKKKVLMRYEVSADGTLSNGRVFFDMTSAPGEDALDGVKVDQQGNLYVSGPGGLWILSRSGKHLGTIRGPEHPHNMAWGQEGSEKLPPTEGSRSDGSARLDGGRFPAVSDDPGRGSRGQERAADDARGDGKTLYLAAQTGLYRIRLKIPGAGANRP